MRSPLRVAFFVSCVLFIGIVLASDSVRSPSSNPQDVCSSLSGPFCLHIGADVSFKSYMTPIDEPQSPNPARSEITTLPASANEPKKCFFRHFKRSWMDAGGEGNDIMSQRVKTSDECEQLCCAHPKCQSYTFWMGHTCFLRGTKNIPREEAHSFSANRIQ